MFMLDKLCLCAHKLCLCAHKLFLCNINIVYVIFVQTAFHKHFICFFLESDDTHTHLYILCSGENGILLNRLFISEGGFVHKG